VAQEHVVERSPLRLAAAASRSGLGFPAEHAGTKTSESAGGGRSGPNEVGTPVATGLGSASAARRPGAAHGAQDVVNVGQRPKADRYGDTVFVAVRMVTLGDEGDLLWEQVSVFFDHDRVVSFQERPGDCLEPLRNRLREGRANIRGGGGAYLACMIIDSIVDGYFPVLDAHAGRLEALEEEVFERPDEAILRDCSPW